MLRDVGTATVSTQLIKRGLRSVVLRGIGPMSRTRSLVGVARTVRFVPAREDLTSLDLTRDPSYPQRYAIEHAQPGEVLVFDCRGELGSAAVGDLLLTRLEQRGAAGLVADGAVRDVGAISQMTIPVFAAGPTPVAHTTRHQAVDTDVPIACGGVQVRPGTSCSGMPMGYSVYPGAWPRRLPGPRPSRPAWRSSWSASCAPAPPCQAPTHRTSRRSPSTGGRRAIPES